MWGGGGFTQGPEPDGSASTALRISTINPSKHEANFINWWQTPSPAPQHSASTIPTRSRGVITSKRVPPALLLTERAQQAGEDRRRL